MLEREKMEFAEIQAYENPNDLIVAAVRADADGTLTSDDVTLINEKLDILYSLDPVEVEKHAARWFGFFS